MTKRDEPCGRVKFYKVENQETLLFPFDIIITAANEYGALAIMELK